MLKGARGEECASSPPIHCDSQLLKVLLEPFGDLYEAVQTSVRLQPCVPGLIWQALSHTLIASQGGMSQICMFCSLACKSKEASLTVQSPLTLMDIARITAANIESTSRENSC